MALAALVATGSTAAFAATDDNGTKTEQCKNKKDCKGKKECKNGDRKGRHDGKCDGLFKGVELTADQQAALKQYRETQETARREAMQKNREDFMNELKSVLTPEQYKQVEQNAAQMRADKESKCCKQKEGMKGRSDKRGGRHEGQRPDRGPRN